MPTRPARASLLLGAVALASLTAGASSAAAKPIVPGATPLWIAAPSSVDAKVRDCPSLAAVDGTGKTTVLRALTTDASADPFGLMFVLLMGDTTVAYCDPTALAARRFAGPITGSSALDTTDGAFWGERQIYGGAIDGGPNGLRIGDHLDLPAGSANATVDVTVAAGGGARTVRLAGTGKAPAHLDVTGSPQAPTVVLTDVDGGQRTTPIATVRAVKFAARITRTGTRARVVVTGRPRTFVAIGLSGIDEDSRFVMLGASGRYTTTLRVGHQRTPTINVGGFNAITREGPELRCRIVGNRGQCGAGRRRPNLASGLALAAAQRPSATTDLAPRAHAARIGAAKPAVAPTTVTRVAASRDFDQVTFAPGDVNADGLPDFVRSKRSHGKATMSVLVSAGGGRWQTVELTGAVDLSSDTVVGDTNGDGRPELRAEAGQIVTDAFGTGPLPASIDLGKRRHPSANDLVPPDVDASTLLSFTSEFSPTGTLVDTTGDGRPEILFGGDTSFVMASEAFPPGRQARIAQILPVFEWSVKDWQDDGLTIGGVESDLAAAADNLSTVGVLGHLYTVEAHDPAAPATTPRQIDVVERTPEGTPLRAASFPATGEPSLLDVDPASGDALIWLGTPKGCGKEDSPRHSKTCTEQIVRVRADGAVRVAVSFRRTTGGAVSAAFTNDGADADGLPEVGFSIGNGLNPDGIRLLGSAQGGSVAGDTLPMLSLGAGRDASWATGIEHVVLPNGSRWISTVTSPVWNAGDKEPPQETLLLQVP